MRTNIEAVKAILVVIMIAVVNFSMSAQSRASYRDSRKITTTAERSYQTNGESRRYLKIDGNTSWYGKIIGGYDLTEKGALAGAAVGIRLNAFRIEAEGTWSEKNPSAMGLVNYDLIKGRIIPFLTVGAGAGKQSTGFQLIENESTGEIQGVNVLRKFQFQATAGAGVSFRVAPHWQLEASYRFTFYPSEKSYKNDRPALVETVGENAKRTIMSEKLNDFGHSVRIALRYHF